jgi:GT2 family glycosyltransferase
MAELGDAGLGDTCPWVRVIVVSYNSGGLVQACVNSLAAQTFPHFEAVIVDNASTDGSADTLQLPDARFRLIRNASNLGFSAANNIGAQGCRAPWIATLNPDAVADPRWFEHLHEGTLRYPAVRMFGATLLDAGDPSIVDGFGDVLSIAGIAWRRGRNVPAANLPNKDAKVFSPCAAAALYARDSFESVGGFDESFFCYLEDVDLGFRLRLAGEQCVQLRRALVYHHGSAITGSASGFTLFHSYRNRLWLIIKSMPLPLLCLAVPLNLVCSLTILAKAKLKHHGTPAMAALRGLGEGLVSAAPMRSRRRVQRGRKISTVDVARCLTWHWS